MTTDRFARLTRSFLYLLIASIAIGAVLAIFIILAGNWDWTATRILLTAGTVAGGSMVGMACGAAISRYRTVWGPAVGMGLGLVAGIMILVGMWAELDSGGYWRATASFSIFAVASAHIALLSLARVQAAHAWVQVVAGAASALFAGMLVAILYSTSVDSGTFQLLAVLGIVAAAFTLIVPIVHFLDRRAVRSPQGEIRPASFAPLASTKLDMAAIDEEIVQLQARLAELRELRRLVGHAPTS